MNALKLWEIKNIYRQRYLKKKYAMIRKKGFVKLKGKTPVPEKTRYIGFVANSMLIDNWHNLILH
jgi:hypothetical protein